MSGPDKITVPVRIGTVVGSFAPVRGPKINGPLRGPEFWSELK